MGNKKIFIFLLSVAAIYLNACSQLKASPAESSPFLENEHLLKPAHERSPWDAVWSSEPEKITVLVEEERKIHIAPVNTQYLNYKKDKTGKEVQVRHLSDDDVKAMADLIAESFTQAIHNTPATNLKLVDDPSEAHLKLELALVELVPTTVAANVAADVGGILLPGTKAAEKAAETGAELAGASLAAGSIAIEMKLSHPASGKILAEAKDRESDKSSVVMNYRDFEKYGWSRQTVKDWSNQFAETFSTPYTTKISAPSYVSFVPW